MALTKLQSNGIAQDAITASLILDNSITSDKILDNTITSAKLTTTGIAAGTYGNATLIPVVTVDEKGRITSAANVAVSIPSFDSPLNVVADDTGGAEIRLPEDTDNGINYVALKANSSIVSNVTFVLPNGDGSSGQVIQTDGSGNLSFISVGSVGSANISAGDSNVTVVDSGTGRVDINVDGSTRAIFNQYGLGLGPNVPDSGYGIRFPATQSASSDANTLDDYEEGTFSPTLTGDGFTRTLNGTFTGARYVKIGRIVTVIVTMLVTSQTGTYTGATPYFNLPFTAQTVTPSMAWNQTLCRMSSVPNNTPISKICTVQLNINNLNGLAFYYYNNGGVNTDAPIDTTGWSGYQIGFTVTYKADT